MTREHAQRELESFTALADGRTIQERLRYVKDAKWTTCSATAPARFDETTEHRVAPEPVLPVDAPCAECGHPVSSHTHRGCLVRSSETRCYCECLRPPEKCGEPAPRMVPLCFPADVKPGDWFRYADGKGSSHVQGGWVRCASVTVICESAIRIEGMGWFNPEAAQEQLEVTHDGGETWSRCEKPAKEEA